MPFRPRRRAKKGRSDGGGTGSGRRREAPPDGSTRPKGGGTKGKANKAGGGSRSTRARSTGAEWLRSGVIVFVIFLFLRSFVIQTFVITSGSMENTLLVGDFLVVNRLAMGSRIPFTDVRIPGYGDPERGDVLVFDPPHEDTLILVKRLVGMPGDTLEMRDKVLYRNGVEQEEPYAVHSRRPDYASPSMLWQAAHLVGGPRDDYRPSRDNWGPIAIPPGRYLMLGDNRDSSLDSRMWGLIERWRFEGRAFAIYFSYNRGSFRPFPWVREVRWDRVWDRIR